MRDKITSDAMVSVRQSEPPFGDRSQYDYGAKAGEVLPALLTVRQFCRLVGIGRTSAYFHMGKQNSALEVAKIGRRTLITRASAEAFIQQSVIRPCSVATDNADGEALT